MVRGVRGHRIEQSHGRRLERSTISDVRCYTFLLGVDVGLLQEAQRFGPGRSFLRSREEYREILRRARDEDSFRGGRGDRRGRFLSAGQMISFRRDIEQFAVVNCYSCGRQGHFRSECRCGIVCFCYGQSGHLARDCLVRDASSVVLSERVCFGCREVGHIRRDCPRRRAAVGSDVGNVVQSFDFRPFDDFLTFVGSVFGDIGCGVGGVSLGGSESVQSNSLPETDQLDGCFSWIGLGALG